MRAPVQLALQVAEMVALSLNVAAPLASQRAPQVIAVTRDGAIASALAHAPRARIARADSASVAASLDVARQFENPILTASYTTAAPQAHLTLDIPVDWAWQRSPRIAAARAQLEAAAMRLSHALATIALEADTTYSRAQAFDARSRLSARSARDADSLSVLARVRRDAGDASDLDLDLALVFAGQSGNIAAADSANAVGALLVLQGLMGISPDSSAVVLAETISIVAADAVAMIGQHEPRGTAFPPSTMSLPVAIAQWERRAAEELERLERGRRLAPPAITMGVETRNPGGPGGLLPLIGVAIPIPLFNRNAPSVLAAQASVLRARATVSQVRLEQQITLSLARRTAAGTRQRAERSAGIANAAERVASLSLLAYQEGAASIASVLDAQRSARDVMAQFADDVAAMRVAERVLRFLLLETPMEKP